MMLFLLIHLALVIYLMKKLLALGRDLFAYNFSDLIRTISASGQLNTINLTLGFVASAFLIGLLYLGIRIVRFSLTAYLVLTGLLSDSSLSFYATGEFR
jgi:hypothetical protein